MEYEPGPIIEPETNKLIYTQAQYLLDWTLLDSMSSEDNPTARQRRTYAADLRLIDRGLWYRDRGWIYYYG